jgi:hypothetical protein
MPCVADRGGEALIQTKQNREIQQTVDKAIYGLRNRIGAVLQPPEKLTARRDPLRQTHRQLRMLCHSCNYPDLD